MAITLQQKICKGAISAFFCIYISQNIFAQTLDIGPFSEGDLSGWEERTFEGNTQYQLIQETDGIQTRQVLKAYTEAAASGLFREIDIDLTQTPYLNWSWKVENIYNANDENQRAGDDYPVRIFVISSGGIFFWNTLAVNYVWSSNQAVDSQWESAVTRNAMMLAVRSGQGEVGQWLSEKRNIREDFNTFFGADITEIHAIAIMSDSDNTGQNATAYYGDIFFSTQ